MRRHPLVLLLSALALTACAHAPRVSTAIAPAAGVASMPSLPEPEPFCLGCTPPQDGGEIVRALAQRVADLKARGGVCESFGAVLEGSLNRGRIVVRPYMWRVGNNLASAQALSSGEIDVARDIDPLNRGRRTLDDVLHSMEHEAAHIALAIPSGRDLSEAAVNERVAECRATSIRAGMTP